MPAPTLGEGNNDADQPNSSRGRAIKRESCLGRIERHFSRSSSTSTIGSRSRILHRTSTTQEGIRKTTKTVDGNEDVDKGRRSSETVHSYRHQHRSHLHPEYSHDECKSVPSVTKLHSRWSSSDADKPPSQPLSCGRQILASGGSSSRVSPVTEGTYKRPRPRLLQRSDSMWTSGGAGTTKDRPPLQPLRRRGAGSTAGVGTSSFQRSAGSSRWISSYRAAVDTPPSHHHALLARHDPMPIEEESSSVSAAALIKQPKRQHSSTIETKEDRADTFEITLMALSIFKMSGKPPALLKTKTAVRCMPHSLRRSKSHD
jgi:hypothetical protein